MEYREQLNFSKVLPFGVEIEVCNKSVEDLSKEQKNSEIQLEKKSFFFKNSETKRWYYKHEDTNEESKDLGLEIISPILHNEKTDLLNLKMVLQWLQQLDAKTNEMCSVHVHMGAESFQKDINKLYNFFLFYLYFEPVFYKFSAMGNFGHVREYAYAYANPVVLGLDLINQKTLKTYIKENASYMHKENGLHFKGFSLTDFGYGSSFELRIFNGTTNECVIENYINVTLSSLEYALSNLFSQGDYQNRCINILKTRKDWHTFENFVDAADSLVDEFVSTIFLDSIDKDYFYEQYKGLCLQNLTK